MSGAAAQIDAHQHFWRLERGDYAWLNPNLEPLYRDYLPADLEPLLHRHGIHQTVLVQAAPTLAETRFLLRQADAHGFIAAVVGWIDMTATDAPEQLAALHEHPRFRGVRPMIQDIDDPDWMLRANLTPAFQAIIDLGLRFDALVQPQHLRNLLKLLERHPDLNVVIDHGGKPDIAGLRRDAWSELIRPLAEHTSACCKLSGLVTEAAEDWEEADIRPFSDELLAHFGPERLMWGSDWPVLNLASDYDTWRSVSSTLLADLSDGDRAAILGGTAARFYELRRGIHD